MIEPLTPLARRLRSESLTDSWLAARLGVDKARIDAMRRSGELIGVRERGSTEWRYPAWQFDGSQPRAAVPRIRGQSSRPNRAGSIPSRMFSITDRCGASESS